MTEIILNRLSGVLNSQNEKELAEFLDVKQNTISTWKQREKIPLQEIYDLAQKKDFSLDYVLLGRTQKNEILNDFEALLGEKGAQEYLAQKLIELVAQKFQMQNLGIYEPLGRFLGFFSKAGADGLYARPLLFLYYVLQNLEKVENQNPKEKLIEAIRITPFHRFVFGPEFNKKTIENIIDHVDLRMDDEEIKILIGNPSTTLKTLEEMMPIAMVKAHRIN